jgi:hypothetical protein
MSDIAKPSILDRIRRFGVARRIRNQRTTIIFHRHDTDYPIIHNLQGLWESEALRGVLETLLAEHYDPKVFCPVCEILWQDGNKTYGEEWNLLFTSNYG